MLTFSRARERALLSLYTYTRRRRDQRQADIGEHAIGLALSERRSDPFLARNVIRNARCTLLRRVRRDVEHRKELSADPDGVDSSFDRVMAGDTISKAAQLPSPERRLLIADSLNMLLDEVERRLGADGRAVAERFEDSVDEVSEELGLQPWRVKELRAGVRAIALRLTDEIRP